MAINTNISVSKTQAQVYKKFKSLSVNEEPLPQGDGTIRISPFDDYYIFTFYDEIDNENVPIDLSNVGTLYISFIGENDEIRIPYYTNVQDLNLAQGQVLFRISKEDSKKILNLDNDNFYVSTQMTSDDNSQSDESIIYTGKFLSITDAARTSLTSQIDDLTLQYTSEVATLTDENASLKKEIESLNSQLSQSLITINTLRISNESLSNELAELNKSISSPVIKKKLNDAKVAQAKATAQYKQASKNSGTVKLLLKEDKATTRLNADRQQKFI